MAIKSRGEEVLYTLLREVFPKAKIIRQYTIAGGLSLDFYLPKLNIAYEFDGISHDKQIAFFHPEKIDFYMSLQRDQEKERLCEQLGINLIRINHSEELTEELVREKYFLVGPGDGVIKDINALSQKIRAKLLQKAARKKAYDYYKQRRKNNEHYKKKNKS